MDAAPKKSQLKVKSLGYKVGKKRLLDDISFEASGGTIVLILGPNGAGKTTLLKHLSGLLAAKEGAIYWHGRRLKDHSHKERAKEMGSLFSLPDTTFAFTVEELIGMGRYPFRAEPFAAKRDKELVDKALRDVELWDRRHDAISRLSSGERQRLGLGRLLAQSPKLYLFDEPTSHLDPYHVEVFSKTLRRLKSEGALVLAVVHDLNLALRLADRVLLLHEGKLLAAGTPLEVLSQERIFELWRVHLKLLSDEEGRLGFVGL